MIPRRIAWTKSKQLDSRFSPVFIVLPQGRECCCEKSFGWQHPSLQLLVRGAALRAPSLLANLSFVLGLKRGDKTTSNCRHRCRCWRQCPDIESCLSQVSWNGAESIRKKAASGPSSIGTSACRSGGHLRDQDGNQIRFLASKPICGGLQEGFSRITLGYSSVGWEIESHLKMRRLSILSTFNPVAEDHCRVAYDLTQAGDCDLKNSKHTGRIPLGETRARQIGFSCYCGRCSLRQMPGITPVHLRNALPKFAGSSRQHAVSETTAVQWLESEIGEKRFHRFTSNKRSLVDATQDTSKKTISKFASIATNDICKWLPDTSTPDSLSNQLLGS